MDAYGEHGDCILRLKSGKEFKVKTKDIGNYDDNNAEIILEPDDSGRFALLDVDSIEYIEFLPLASNEALKQ